MKSTSGSFVRRLVKTARATLRDRDNLPSYPTLSRTVSDGRTGDWSVNFDDTQTITYTTSSQLIRYPLCLPVDDPRYLSSIQAKEALGSVPVIGVGGGITTTGSIVKGVSDALLTDIPGTRYSSTDLSTSNFKPFTEDGISYAPRNANDWWATGSILTDVGEGFTQPVWSKTKIEIDISPTQTTEIGFRTYSNDTAYAPDRVVNLQPTNYPMGYFNFADKKWEPIGSGSHWGGFDKNQTHRRMEEWAQNTCVGFSAGRNLPAVGLYESCRPITTFGFPNHPKFHATSSQTLSLSNYIKHPFLLEKYVIELVCDYTSSYIVRDATDQTKMELNVPSYRTLLIGDDINQSNQTRVLVDANIAAGTINTFFLLKQRNNTVLSSTNVYGSDVYGSPIIFTGSIPTNIVLSDGASPTYVNTTRELITYSQLTSYSGSKTPFNSNIDVYLKNGLARETNIDTSIEQTQSTSSIFGTEQTLPAPFIGTGPWNDYCSFTPKKLTISGTVRMLPINNAVGFLVSSIDEFSSEQLSFKGKTGVLDEVSGRSITKDIPTQLLIENDKISDVRYQLAMDMSVTGMAKAPLGSYDIQSPYILFPQDNLILGCQVPLSPDTIKLTSGSGFPHDILRFFNAPAKLTLYGSLIRESVEYHEPSNQPLNTNAIHEALHHDNPVLDQFETATRYEYSGSYTDGYMTGSLVTYNSSTKTFTTSSRDVTFNVCLASSRTGSIGETPLSIKMIQQNEYAGLQVFTRHSTKERYYDSLTPGVSDIIKTLGKTFETMLTNVGSIEDDTMQLFATLYPFEPKFSNIQRMEDISKSFIVSTNLGVSIPPKVVNSLTLQVATDLISGQSVSFWIDYTHLDSSGDLTLNQVGLNKSDISKLLFGWGDYCPTQYYDTMSSPIPPPIENFNNQVIPRAVIVVPGPMGSQTTVLVSPIIRGWKYGLLSALPTYSSCVFRRGHYGQLRDMLEQRLDTKYTFDNTTTSAVVNVKFVDPRTKKTIPAENTWSSNLSFECTSSLPYFDGDVRNRTPINLSSLNTSTVLI